MRAGLVVFAVGVLGVGCGGRPYKSPNYGGGGTGVPPMRAAAEPQAESGDYPGEAVVLTAQAGTAHDGEDEGGGGAPAPPPLPSKAKEEALVVEGSVYLQVDDVAKSAAGIGDEARRRGGRVIAENLGGGARGGRLSASMRLRLPPGEVQTFLAWLDEGGDIISRNLQATDVSKTLFDQKIALENLELTLSRLQALLQNPGALNDVLAVEREMQRVRGEIERLKGEKRYLEDRVTYATLDISLSQEGEVFFGGPKAKFYPGVRASVLYLPDASVGMDEEAPDKTRVGFGVAIEFGREWGIDIDLYPDPEGGADEGTGLIVTTGGAFFSDFLGRGRRAFLNPYLGVRLGYGSINHGDYFVLQGEVGVELFKHRYVLVEAFARGGGLIGDQSQVAVQAGGALVVAF